MAKKTTRREKKAAEASMSRPPTNDSSPNFPDFSKRTFYGVGFGVALAVGAIYAQIIHNVLEQRYWWSNISEQRKEVIFHSEQSMYYRYFKDTTNISRSLPQVFYSFLNDGTVESPGVINAFKRFNIWPEFLVGVMYRIFNVSGAEPIDYYVHVVMSWSMFMMAGIACLTYIIQTWNRDNNRPFNVKSRMPFIVLIALTTSAMLSWQLAASIMALQVAALFLTYLLGYLTTTLFVSLVKCHLISIAMTTTMMFGNEMLISSPYTITSLGSLVGIVGCEKVFGTADVIPYPRRLTRSFMVGMVSILVALAIKVALHTMPFLPVGDDAHMYNLLRAKMSDFEDFHTSLYLHSEAFQMIQWYTLTKLTTTGILPMAIVGVLVVTVYVLRDVVLGTHNVRVPTTFDPNNEKFSSSPTHTPLSHVHESNPHLPSELVFNTVFFLCMSFTAALFQRLRFLWVPYMGIMAVAICARQVTFWDTVLLGMIKKKGGKRLPIVQRQMILAVCVIGIAWVGSAGWSELRWRLNTEEEYQLPEMIKLNDWIKANTPMDAVIAGDMSTMGSVRLMSGRSTANHPHYEDKAIRHKTYEIAHWFGWRSIPDVHAILVKYNITHFVNHIPPCIHALTKQGTGYANFVELGEDGRKPHAANRTTEKCCIAVANPKSREGYFELVRDTKDWPVYKVLRSE
eukprot:CFRG5667T1